MPSHWLLSVQQRHGRRTHITPITSWSCQGDLEWVDAGGIPPGAKNAAIKAPLNEAVPFTFRVKFPADYKIPAHWHPAVERVTVLSGTFNFGTGDKLDTTKSKALTPGSFEIMPAKTNHFAWTSEETVVQIQGVGPVDYQLRESRGRSAEEVAPRTRRMALCCGPVVRHSWPLGTVLFAGKGEQIALDLEVRLPTECPSHERPGSLR